jgi:hypothetical protein
MFDDVVSTMHESRGGGYGDGYGGIGADAVGGGAAAEPAGARILVAPKLAH